MSRNITFVISVSGCLIMKSLELLCTSKHKLQHYVLEHCLILNNWQDHSSSVSTMQSDKRGKSTFPICYLWKYDMAIKMFSIESLRLIIQRSRGCFKIFTNADFRIILYSYDDLYNTKTQCANTGHHCVLFPSAGLQKLFIS